MHPASSRPTTPRQRARATTIDDAKAIALRQLAEGGVEAISLKAISLELGLTGPAIYRYFASRNDLLTELIVDAYDDLATAIGAAASATATRSGAAQLDALADAYRGWALGQPHRYRLLYAAPVPGYEPNAQRLVDAANRTMATLIDVYAQTGISSNNPLTKRLAKQLRQWGNNHQRGSASPDILYLAVITWTRLHGFVSLEIENAFTSMGVDPDTIFRREVDALTTS
jgi:AcrR family transcriptional regulator